MNTATIIAAIFLNLTVIASACAQNSDSASWPFDGPIGCQFNISGVFDNGSAVWDPNETITDSTSQETVQEPNWNEIPPNGYALYWQDGTHVGNTWSFDSSYSFGLASIDAYLVVDTANHIIDSLEYTHYDQDYASWGGTTSVILRNIHYDQSSLYFTDNDLMRHGGASYNWSAGHVGLATKWQESVSVSELSVDDANLIQAFQFHNANFGDVNVGQIKDSTLVLANASDTALLIRSYTLLNMDSGFSLIDTSLHLIPAEDSGTITVRFVPKGVQSYSGTIQIATDEPYAPPYIIQLTGNVATSIVSSISSPSEVLTILPTISNGLATVSLPAESGSLTVYDILGSEMYSNTVMHNSSLSLVTRLWPNGTYYAVFSSTHESATAKFIVRH